MSKLTIHMIGNAHLDPAWLWTWPAGLDEAIATCSTACNMLDAYPELVITRGEAWVHMQIEKLAPGLFKRIAAHVQSGRWAIVNGWWIQPDCNLPTRESFQKQAAVGKAWFMNKLGVDVTVGYNVDSFGHAATLPAFLVEAGFDSYVFMRPAAHEKTLPADLFRWEAPNGDAIDAYRITGAYNASTPESLDRSVSRVVAGMDRDIGHAMCFYGIGDHGGGPTKKLVDWILEHRHYSDDVELIFSHPAAFFDAVRQSSIRLPVVCDELQFHAIGCYSAVHAMKQRMRVAETLAARAETLAVTFPDAAPPDSKKTLDAAWERILFNQFHDILAGSSIKTVYDYALDELGGATAAARDIVVDITRRRTLELPPADNQRLVIQNIASRRYAGYVEVEPWTPFGCHASSLYFTDDNGEIVPHQRIVARAAVTGLARYLLPVNVPAFGYAVIHVHYDGDDNHGRTPEIEDHDQPADSYPLKIDTGSIGVSAVAERTESGDRKCIDGVALCVFQDLTDTWSHGVAGYDGPLLGTFSIDGAWKTTERGVFRVTKSAWLHYDGSRAFWTISQTRDETIMRMKLKVIWQGAHRILKLIIRPGFTPERRLDGVPGGEIARDIDGREYPLHDVTTLIGTDAALSVITPDAFGVDVLPDGAIRVTLLRSPVYAHHAPLVLEDDHHYPVTDQGEHEYAVSLVPAADYDLECVRDEIYRLSDPLVVSETTDGMPMR